MLMSESLLQKFNNASTFEDEKRIVPNFIEYILDKGISNFQLNFWNNMADGKKESFIRGLFIILIEKSTEKKTKMLNILRDLYLNSPDKIQEQILMIMYASLFEEQNFRLSLAALDFFTEMFNYYNSEQKDDIFAKLLDFIQSSEPYSADEGIRSLLGIADQLSDRQRMEFFQILIELSKRRDKRLKYVAFETLTLLVHENKSFFKKDRLQAALHLISATAAKNKRLKDVKVLLSLIRLMLQFSEYLDADQEQFILKKIKRSIKQMEEQYYKQLLPILKDYWEILGDVSHADYFKIVLPFILELYAKKSTLSSVVYDLLEEYLQLIWNYLPVEEKNKFY